MSNLKLITCNQDVVLDQSPNGIVLMEKKSTLEEAQAITRSDRAITHGPFDDNFKRAAKIFNAWTDSSITPSDVCKILMALKQARMERNPNYRDNYVDLEGYTDLLFRLQTDGVL